MTRITVTMELDSPLTHVWSRLVDWESHSEWIPATTVHLTNTITGVGATFTGTTRLGPLVLEDPMTVTEYATPQHGKAHCLVTKNGLILGGTAGFTLTQRGKDHTHLEWFEDIQLRPATVFWWTAPVVYAVGRLAFTAALAKFAATL